MTRERRSLASKAHLHHFGSKASAFAAERAVDGLSRIRATPVAAARLLIGGFGRNLIKLDQEIFRLQL